MDNELIRTVRVDEMNALIDLYHHLHLVDDPLPDAAALQPIWQQIVDNPCIHCLVTEYDQQLIASCTLTVIPNLTRGARAYGLIENVVTHADYRQRGVGTRLLQHALKIAWEQHNCYKVMLLTGSKRESTLRFYEKAGFQSGAKTAFVAKPTA